MAICPPQVELESSETARQGGQKTTLTLSGPATRHILEREHLLYKRPEYARLAGISVAQLYNLRHHQRYRERLLSYTRTRPAAVSIGERRKPQPQGQPGFLGLDTMHQGDQSEGGEKGVYHINAVDQVPQWEIAGSTPCISEAYLEPVLEHMLRQFPFRIQGFYTDNGSEFINRMVARLLNKLRIEQTKSRPRQSGDSGLVETKNGAIIGKHIGYGYIDAKHADAINDFYCEHLNPYLNYQRPARVAGTQFHLSMEADLRSGLRRAALLKLAASAQQPFSHQPAIGLAELCSESGFDPRSALLCLRRSHRGADSKPLNGTSHMPRPTAPHRTDPCAKCRRASLIFHTRKEKPASPTRRFLQAHLWIGKDCRCQICISGGGGQVLVPREEFDFCDSMRKIADHS